MWRTGVLLVAVCCVAATGGPESFVGTDYGDMIDGLRRQLDTDSYSFGGDVSSPSTINRVRLQLRDIQDRLLTETANAESVFEAQQAFFTERLTKVNQTLNATKEWLDDVKNKTRINSDRIVERQIYLKQSPELLAAKAEQILKQNATINKHIQKRTRENVRFNQRVHFTKEALAGAIHVASFFDTTTLSARLTTLQDTLNVNHDPALSSLVSSLGPDALQEKTSDLGDVRNLLGELIASHHEFLLDITKTEIINANASATQLESLNSVLQMLQAEEQALRDEAAAAKTEIAERMEENIRLHKLYPAKVYKYEKLLGVQKQLIANHEPLQAVFNVHKSKRAEQLAKVINMLDLIHLHYDPKPKVLGSDK